jgi:branched-chain amino acid transport system permease protein
VSNPDIALSSIPAATRRPRIGGFATEAPIAALVLAALFGLIHLFSGDSFTLNILAATLMYAGLSSAWNIIGGFGGQFSLGHSVFFALGAYVTANLFLRFDISPWISLLPAMIAAAALAALVSWPVFRLRGPFFAIATMALTEVAMALAMYFDTYTGGAQGLSVPFKAGLENMIFKSRMDYAFLMLGFFGVVLFVSAWLKHSRLGYSLRAVRDNEATAEAAGIAVLRVKLIGMSISAALMAAGGCLFMMYVRVVDPFSLFSLFDIGVKVAMIALIGGIGTIYGPLLGALLLLPLENYLRAEMAASVPGGNLIVLGVILILTALYLRHGIFGALMALARRVTGDRT